MEAVLSCRGDVAVSSLMPGRYIGLRNMGELAALVGAGAAPGRPAGGGRGAGRVGMIERMEALGEVARDVAAEEGFLDFFFFLPFLSSSSGCQETMAKYEGDNEGGWVT